jgi:NADPH-dependent curcumin reductase CurA
MNCLMGGLKVYGSVGDDAKLEYLLKDLNFDGGFNYKKDAAKDILPKLIPQGIGISSTPP